MLGRVALSMGSHIQILLDICLCSATCFIVRVCTYDFEISVNTARSLVLYVEGTNCLLKFSLVTGLL